MVERATEAAKIKIKAQPHMLRHACGFKLANDGSIPDRSRRISGIGIFNIPSVIPSWRRIGSGFSPFSLVGCSRGLRKPAFHRHSRSAIIAADLVRLPIPSA